MTINLIQFEPDSCKCAFDFTWDDVNLVRTFVAVRNTCQFHSGLTGVALCNTVWDDDVRKGNVIVAGVNAQPSLLSTTGASGGALVSGVTFRYGWTNFQNNRTLWCNYQGSGVAPNAVQLIAIQSGITAVASGRAFAVANVSGVSGITIVV